eukprot:tig00020557_g11116.t1
MADERGGKRAKLDVAPPPCWIDVPRMGKPCRGFLPFKTPLGPSYDDKLEEDQRFDVTMFAEAQVLAKRDVGLVIDLTRGEYYDPREWADWDIQYKKLPIEFTAAGVVEDRSVEAFREACINFWRESPSRFIAVHDVVGASVLGYLLVTVLVIDHNLRLNEAIQTFAASRPPGIYKRTLLSALYELLSPLDETSAEQLPCPVPPDWDLQGIAGAEDIGRALPAPAPPGPPSAGPSRPPQAGPSSRPDGPKPGRAPGGPPAPGQPAPGPLSGLPRVTGPVEASLLKTLGELAPPGSPKWPGAEPVPLPDDKDAALEATRGRKLLATWAPRGLRCLLLLLGPRGVFALDPSMSLRHLPGMQFPDRKRGGQPLDGTLLDGWAVLDADPGGATVRRFLAQDALAIRGQSLASEPLPWPAPFLPVLPSSRLGLAPPSPASSGEDVTPPPPPPPPLSLLSLYPAQERRLGVIQHDVIAPRKEAQAAAGAAAPSREPLHVRMKDWFPARKVPTLLPGCEFAKRLPHKLDGLLLSPADSHYTVPPLAWRPGAPGCPPAERLVELLRGCGHLD